ncbi:coproporphyrinogen III oxidase [Scytonema sp. UIC 10036]|nr:coproporphyrinogen III oxidase [Scytonema sp. UIC 10036]
MAYHSKNQIQLLTSPSNTLPADSRARVKQLMQNLQDEICTALEQLDGKARCREDCWQRAEGGEGLTRVIREGRVFEQGSVNFSEVWGDTLPTPVKVSICTKIY